jgi:hypothetical protein
MKYAAQVVWCIDPGDPAMLFMAEGLHGKRVAKGEGGLSQMVFGLSPNWPLLPATTDNIRLYVIAHGVNVSGVGTPAVKIAIGHPVSATTTQTAAEFFLLLRDLVQKSPQHRVRRISLVMCNGAGIQGKMNVGNSFAKQLADLCGGLTVDITARNGELTVHRTSFPKPDIDEGYFPDTNPLYTVMIEGKECSVVNARKLPNVITQGVKQMYHRFRTYVIVPNQAPELKPDYTE